MRRVAVALIGIVGVLCAGDVVVMQDGTRYEGRIQSIAFPMGNIELQLSAGKRESLNAAMVPRIVFGAEAVEVTAPEPAPANAPPKSTAQPAVQYAMIPLHGALGEEILAHDVNELLRGLSGRYNAIVFHVDCPGGFRREAERIVEAIESKREKMTMIAIVKDARSTAIPIVLACDHVLIEHGGLLGGPGTYPSARRSGDLNKPFSMDRSAMESLVRTSHNAGWPEELCRSLAGSPWKTIDSAGAAGSNMGVHPTKRRFRGESSSWTKGRALTSWTEELATAVEPGADRKWREKGRGVATMAEAVESWTKFNNAKDSRSAKRSSLTKTIREAKAAEPWGGTYPSGDVGVNRRSRAKWDAACDESLDKWKEARELAERLNNLERDAARYYKLHVVNMQQLQQDYDECCKREEIVRAAKGRCVFTGGRSGGRTGGRGR